MPEGMSFLNPGFLLLFWLLGFYLLWKIPYPREEEGRFCPRRGIRHHPRAKRGAEPGPSSPFPRDTGDETPRGDRGG